MGRRIVSLAIAASFAIGWRAWARDLTRGEPVDIVVGPPRGLYPTPGANGRRDSRVRAPIAAHALTELWTKSIGRALEHSPITAGETTLVAVGGRSELVFVDTNGQDIRRLGLRTSGASAPTALSNGTIVVLTTEGDAVGATSEGIRFRRHLFPGGRNVPRDPPLSLDDGGFVVASRDELVACDSAGLPKARARLSEAVAEPLVVGAKRVLAVTTSGAVYAWFPGTEPERLGGFAQRPDGPVVSSGGDLLAVVGHRQLVALRLRDKVAVTRAAPAGEWLLGPPAMRGRDAIVATERGGQAFLVAFGPGGHERVRRALTKRVAPSGADAGAQKRIWRTAPSWLVGSGSALVFADPDGKVGVLDPSGGIEWPPHPPCGKSSGSIGPRTRVVGIVPLSDGGWVVACAGGTLVAYAGRASRGTEAIAPGKARL